MKQCSLCGFKSETGAGLASHHRAKHARRKGANRKAIERLLAETEREIDPATRQAALSIADALDVDPTNAQMWRTYREVIGAIAEEDDAGDETDAEVEAIRSTAPMGHLKAL